MRTPEFWEARGVLSTLLQPLAALQGAAGHLRQGSVTPWRAPVPVLCVGNLVAGGAGKTPVAAGLARILRRMGRVPSFLSRGYGGSLTGPVRVDPARHSWRDVGDEPMLLAEIAPCWIARDRVAGAKAAIAAGAEVLLLDDGFQNPSLAKDWSLLVVDGAYGFGNRRLLPAGPLREPIARGLGRANAAVVIGPHDPALAREIEARVPLLHAELALRNGQDFTGKPVLAFAGIGRPAKFYASLAACGAQILETRDFADHHPYSETELREIVARAGRLGAIPVTTAKDLARIPPALRPVFRTLEIDIFWTDEARLLALLESALLPRDARG